MAGVIHDGDIALGNVVDKYMKNQPDKPHAKLENLGHKGPQRNFFEVSIAIGGDSEPEPTADDIHSVLPPPPGSPACSQHQVHLDHGAMLVQDPTGPEGQQYQGQFLGDKKHGNGVLHSMLGTGRLVYEGEFCENEKQGRGVLQWEDGRVYQGQFLHNEFHGEGVMKWADGRQYIGQYANGRKEGVGTCYFPDGSLYQGQFHKGRRHGEIVYVKADGSRKLVHFKMDKAYKVDRIRSDGDDESPTSSDCTTDASDCNTGRNSTSSDIQCQVTYV